MTGGFCLESPQAEESRSFLKKRTKKLLSVCRAAIQSAHSFSERTHMHELGDAWKGMQTSRPPVFLSYARIERMIEALLPRAAAWTPDLVAGIARARRQAGAHPEPEHQRPYIALDLDGIFKPDLPLTDYAENLQATLAHRDTLAALPNWPDFSQDRAVIITGRPETDRARTQTWLQRWGLGPLPLEMRPPNIPDAPETVAAYKAQTALRLGCTHFIESDAQQAILSATHAPHLVMTWWDATRGTSVILEATQAPGA